VSGVREQISCGICGCGAQVLLKMETTIWARAVLTGAPASDRGAERCFPHYRRAVAAVAAQVHQTGARMDCGGELAFEIGNFAWKEVFA